MSTQATDDFDRANGGLGANWTTANSCTAPDILTNECRADNDPEGAYWNGYTPPADQWSETIVGTVLMVTSDNGAGPAIRQATGADSKYFSMANFGDKSRLYKVAAGVYTSLGVGGGAIAIGDALYLEGVGTAIKVKINGAESISVTDSGVTAAGRLALFGANEGAVNPTIASWQGGDITSGVAHRKVNSIPIGSKIGGLLHT